MRRAALLLLCATLLLGLPPRPAAARGGGATVERHLLEKGVGELRRAEAAWFQKDRKRAASHGRVAERLFRDVLTKKPKHAEAARLAAQAATFSGDMKGAKSWAGHYLRLSSAGEGDPSLHYLRAFIHLLGDDRPDRALRSLLQMYSLNARVRPHERDSLWFLALLELGSRYLKAGKSAEAAKRFASGARIARRLGSRSKEILMLANLGVAYMRANRHIEAADIYRGLETLEPNNALWTWRLGMSLANQSRFADATAAYRKVIDMQKAGKYIVAADEVALLPLRLGNCLRHLSAGEPDPKKSASLLDEAQANLEAYVKGHPRDVAGHNWLGVLMQESRDKPYAALAHFKQAFALDPMCESVLRRMIQIHARHPAPEGTAAKTWKQQREIMEKDLREGAERRKETVDEREKRTGGSGCE